MQTAKIERCLDCPRKAQSPVNVSVSPEMHLGRAVPLPQSLSLAHRLPQELAEILWSYRRKLHEWGESSEAFPLWLSILEDMSSVARRVARLLKAANLKVVFAESCTGGLVSGTLTKIAGISAHHCGGVVVYRNETKQSYLDIPAAMLTNPGPVSREVAELMALRVLEKTPEADIAASVTGHLGPQAPPKLDGLVFIAVARRGTNRGKPEVLVKQLRCRKQDSRVVRQRWVVGELLSFLAVQIARGKFS